MDELKKSIMYLEHGNELVISKIRVLIDSLIKYQEGTLPVSDMLFDAFKRRIIRFNGQLSFDDYIIVFERPRFFKCLTLREYTTGIMVEYGCRSIGTETTNSKEVLIQLLSVFMDTAGIIATPVWGLLEVFNDSEAIEQMGGTRKLQLAYKRSVCPICYIESHGRLLPIYCKEHADRIEEIYNQSENGHCHNNLDQLLGHVTNKRGKLTYNLEKKN